jgi:hypothetical protein
VKVAAVILGRRRLGTRYKAFEESESLHLRHTTTPGSTVEVEVDLVADQDATKIFHVFFV